MRNASYTFKGHLWHIQDFDLTNPSDSETADVTPMEFNMKRVTVAEIFSRNLKPKKLAVPSPGRPFLSTPKNIILAPHLDHFKSNQKYVSLHFLREKYPNKKYDGDQAPSRPATYMISSQQNIISETPRDCPKAPISESCSWAVVVQISTIGWNSCPSFVGNKNLWSQRTLIKLHWLHPEVQRREWKTVTDLVHLSETNCRESPQVRG